MITTIIIKNSFDFLWPGLCVYELYISLSLGMPLGLKGLFLRLVRGRLACGSYFCYAHCWKGPGCLGVVEQSSEKTPNWALGGSGQDTGRVLQWTGDTQVFIHVLSAACLLGQFNHRSCSFRILLEEWTLRRWVVAWLKVWMINILRETKLRYLSQLLGLNVLSILHG